MYCTHCGAKLRDGAKFCAKCGQPTPLAASGDGQVASTARQASQPTVQPASQPAQPMSQPASQPAAQPAVPSPTNGSQGMGPGTKYAIVGAVVAALLVMVVVALKPFGAASPGATSEAPQETDAAQGQDDQPASDDERYSNVLSAYRAAQASGWTSGDDAFPALKSVVDSTSGPGATVTGLISLKEATCVYVYTDLDGDGVNELVVGASSDSVRPFAIYDWSQNTSAYEANDLTSLDCKILADGNIVAWMLQAGESGARCAYQDGGLAMTEYHCFYHSDSGDPHVHVFGDSEADAKPVTVDNLNAVGQKIDNGELDAQQESLGAFSSAAGAGAALANLGWQELGTDAAADASGQAGSDAQGGSAQTSGGDSADTWKAAYAQLLDQADGVLYALVDMSGDGVPELLTQGADGTSEDISVFYLNPDNGTATVAGMVPNGMVAVAGGYRSTLAAATDRAGLVLTEWLGGTGEGSVSLYTLRGGEVASETLADFKDLEIPDSIGQADITWYDQEERSALG